MKFLRNDYRQSLRAKDSPEQWFSVNLSGIVSVHVYTEDGRSWRFRLTGVATHTSEKSFASQREAEKAATEFTDKKLKEALSQCGNTGDGGRLAQ